MVTPLSRGRGHGERTLYRQVVCGTVLTVDTISLRTGAIGSGWLPAGCAGRWRTSCSREAAGSRVDECGFSAPLTPVAPAVLWRLRSRHRSLRTGRRQHPTVAQASGPQTMWSTPAIRRRRRPGLAARRAPPQRRSSATAPRSLRPPSRPSSPLGAPSMSPSGPPAASPRPSHSSTRTRHRSTAPRPAARPSNTAFYSSGGGEYPHPFHLRNRQAFRDGYRIAQEQSVKHMVPQIARRPFSMSTATRTVLLKTIRLSTSPQQRRPARSAQFGLSTSVQKPVRREQYRDPFGFRMLKRRITSCRTTQRKWLVGIVQGSC
jgi:hypothetical protein